jgi:hypothetical protein
VIVANYNARRLDDYGPEGVDGGADRRIFDLSKELNI